MQVNYLTLRKRAMKVQVGGNIWFSEEKLEIRNYEAKSTQQEKRKTEVNPNLY